MEVILEDRYGWNVLIMSRGPDPSKDCTAKRNSIFWIKNHSVRWSENTKILCPHHIQQICKICTSLQTEAHRTNISPSSYQWWINKEWIALIFVVYCTAHSLFRQCGWSRWCPKIPAEHSKLVTETSSYQASRNVGWISILLTKHICFIASC